MRKLFRLLTIAAFMLCGVTAAQAEDKTIKMGTMGWEDLTPLSLITKKFLEQEGYTVELTTFSEWGIAYGALAKGDVDILASQINYVASDYWSKNKNRLEKISVLSHGLQQRLVVPSYMPINSMEQLNDVADQVGGKIIGIEPGSGLMREAHAAVEAYGLKYQIIDGSTAAMVAQLQSTLERKEPIVTMLWDPSWMIMKYDVKFLDDPKHVFAPPQTYYWIGKKGFSEAHPHAREVLASIYVPLSDVTAINGAMNDGQTVEQAVEVWWKDHAELVGKWAVLSSN